MLEQWYWVLPNEVLFNKDLSDKQKLLFCLISSLCAEKWYCWATNRFLWEKLGVWERTISNSIKVLNEMWFIQVDTENSQRKISLVKNHKGYVKNHKGGMWKITNIIIQENNISSYEDIYTSYYWKKKWIDEKVCNKLIDDKLKQWITLDDILKWMVLYNCECRLKQDFTYVMKFETWIRWFHPLNEQEIDESLYVIVKAYRDKKKSDDKFWQSSVSKTIWNDLKSTFWDEKVKWMLKQANSIQLNFT